MVRSRLSGTVVNAVCIVSIVTLVAVVIQRALSFQSADLYAVWLAGEFMSMGRLDQVYPENTVMFDMTTPSDWWGHVSKIDPTAYIYPYLYPPIWARFASWLTQVTTFGAFDTVMAVMNQAFLIASIVLAGKMLALTRTTLLAVVAFTYAALAYTYPVGIGIDQNQLQIFVSFLIVLAFERVHTGHLKTGGMILALAASLKIYPLLFVIIFVARRQWNAVVWFAIAGGLLGVASILLVGWPLHAEFLRLVGVMSKSVIVTNVSFSIDSVIARIFFSEAMIEVRHHSEPDSVGFWGAMRKPALWVTISTVAQIMSVVVVYLLSVKRPNDVLVVPIAAVVFSLVSPLSWCYSYMTALVFIGVLIVRGGRVNFAVACCLVGFFLPVALPFAQGSLINGQDRFQILGTALMAVYMFALLGLMRTAAVESSQTSADTPVQKNMFS